MKRLILLSMVAAPLAAQAPVARPLTLDEALALAIPASEDVAIARADIQRAEGEVKRVRADLLPQLTGSAAYTRTLKSQFNTGSGRVDSTATTSCRRFTGDPALPVGERVDSLERSVECLSALNPFAALGDLPFGRKHQYNLGLQFSQTLFSSGILKGRPRAAVAGRRLARLGLTAAEAQTRLDVTAAYFDAVLSDRLVTIAELSLAQAETTLAQTRLGREVGTQPEFDLLRARVTRDNQRSAVIQRRSARSLTYLRLSQLLGLPLNQPLELTTPLAEAPPVAEAGEDSVLILASDTAAAERAAVRQAAEAVTVQEVLTNVTRWDRVPTVKLTSNFARIGYPTDGLPWNASFVSDWTLGVTLSMPLWTSGRLRGNAMVQEAGLDQARARLAQAHEGAVLDARQSVERLTTALAAWSATQGTVEQAERAYAIATLRYREGISTQTELTDARLLLEQAQANRATAARDVRVARARLTMLQELPLASNGVSTTLSNAASGLADTQQSRGN